MCFNEVTIVCCLKVAQSTIHQHIFVNDYVKYSHGFHVGQFKCLFLKWTSRGQQCDTTPLHTFRLLQASASILCETNSCVKTLLSGTLVDLLEGVSLKN